MAAGRPGEESKPPLEEPSQELLPKLSRYLEYFQAIAEVGKVLTSNLELTEVLRSVVEAISRLLRPDNWSLLLLDPSGKELHFEIAVGEASGAVDSMRVPADEGIAGWAIRHRKGVWIPDVTRDPRFSPRVDRTSRFRSGSVICVPLLCRDRPLGAIELVKVVEDPQPFTQEHLQVLNLFAEFVAIAIDNARNFKRVEDLTMSDEWTGLYNARFLRTRLGEEVSRSRRYARPLSLLFLDLDGFKGVNDVHGHSVGSRVLREIGSAILHRVRETDRVVRYGGDEFVVLMPETAKKEAMVAAERLRSTIDALSWTADGTITGVSISASIGVAAFPDDGDEPQALIDVADRAMYLGKARGRNSIVDASEVV